MLFGRRPGGRAVFLSSQLPDTVFHSDFMVGVGEEGKVEVVGIAERFDRGDGIGADAQDGDVGFVVGGDGVAEGAGFLGATGGAGLGIEIKDDDLFALIVGEGDLLAGVGGELEAGGDVPVAEGWRDSCLKVGLRVGLSGSRRRRCRAGWLGRLGPGIAALRAIQVRER